MALPSARRPPAAQKLLDEEAEQLSAKHLKLKVNLPSVFIDSMVSWYEQLVESKRKKLTPLKLKRIAVQKCYDVNYDYDNLPPDWIITLRDRCGLRLYDKKRNFDFSVTPVSYNLKLIG